MVIIAATAVNENNIRIEIGFVRIPLEVITSSNPCPPRNLSRLLKTIEPKLNTMTIAEKALKIFDLRNL